MRTTQTCGSELARDRRSTRFQTVGGPGYPQCAHDSSRLYQAIITSCSNELWPMRNRLNELFSQRSRKCRMSFGAGVFPAAPDPGQRSAGHGHPQHIEQLPGQLEHFRRQVMRGCNPGFSACHRQRSGICSAVTAPSSITGISARRNSRSPLRNVTKPLAGDARRAAAEAGAEPGGGEKGCWRRG